MTGIWIDALGPRGSYRARERKPVVALSGSVLGEISQVPTLYIRRTLAAMRAAPMLSAAERFDVLAFSNLCTSKYESLGRKWALKEASLFAPADAEACAAAAIEILSPEIARLSGPTRVD